LFEDGGDRWIPRAQVTQMTNPEWNQDFEQNLGVQQATDRNSELRSEKICVSSPSD
jgi:hypothetical protein